jgi:hypothetical protein
LPIPAIKFFNAFCALKLYVLFISLSQATKIYQIKVNHPFPNPFQLTEALMQRSLEAGDTVQFDD